MHQVKRKCAVTCAERNGSVCAILPLRIWAGKAGLMQNNLVEGSSFPSEGFGSSSSIPYSRTVEQSFDMKVLMCQ